LGGEVIVESGEEFFFGDFLVIIGVMFGDEIMDVLIIDIDV
jgi:hypothetical protein